MYLGIALGLGLEMFLVGFARVLFLIDDEH